MQLVVTFPLVVAIVSAGLVRFQRSLEEAAIDLGASQVQMLRYVVLPADRARRWPRPAIFAFAWSFNNFEISFFTGGFEQTFPVWVFSILRQSENLPLVNAVSTVIALAQVIVVFGAWQLIKRAHPRRAAATRRSPTWSPGRCADGSRLAAGPPQRRRGALAAAAARVPGRADGDARCCSSSRRWS